MLLKVAYFRVIGIADTQDLSVGPLRTIYTLAEWHGRNLHDLQALVSLLIDRRRTLGVPLDNVTAGEILWHALMVDSHWRETLRYKYTPALEEELHEVYNGVEWLFAHQELLWR